MPINGIKKSIFAWVRKILFSPNQKKKKKLTILKKFGNGRKNYKN